MAEESRGQERRGRRDGEHRVDARIGELAVKADQQRRQSAQGYAQHPGTPGIDAAVQAVLRAGVEGMQPVDEKADVTGLVYEVAEHRAARRSPGRQGVIHRHHHETVTRQVPGQVGAVATPGGEAVAEHQQRGRCGPRAVRIPHLAVQLARRGAGVGTVGRRRAAGVDEAVLQGGHRGRARRKALGTVTGGGEVLGLPGKEGVGKQRAQRQQQHGGGAPQPPHPALPDPARAAQRPGLTDPSAAAGWPAPRPRREAGRSAPPRRPPPGPPAGWPAATPRAR